MMQALAIDKTTLSRLLKMASRLPKDIIEAIGPAPPSGGCDVPGRAMPQTGRWTWRWRAATSWQRRPMPGSSRFTAIWRSPPRNSR